jgi:hypothetical protein
MADVKILLPKRNLPEVLAQEICRGNRKVFFLAGPIKGGGGWQARACELFEQLSQEPLVLVVPCRWGEDLSHPLASKFIDVPEDKEAFPRQTLWERRYLDLAAGYAGSGVIFWLTAQVGPRPIELGPYGRDTLGELGEWRGIRNYRRDTKLVLGIEKTEANEKYFGLSVMEANWSDALDKKVEFRPSLFAVVEDALNGNYV